MLIASENAAQRAATAAIGARAGSSAAAIDPAVRISRTNCGAW